MGSGGRCDSGRGGGGGGCVVVVTMVVKCWVTGPSADDAYLNLPRNVKEN